MTTHFRTSNITDDQLFFLVFVRKSDGEGRGVNEAYLGVGIFFTMKKIKIVC